MDRMIPSLTIAWINAKMMFYLPSDKVPRHCILSHKMSNDGTEDSV